MRINKKKILGIILLTSLILNLYMGVRYYKINSMNEKTKVIYSNIEEWNEGDYE